jgi:Fur family ferric uptake transcriptional regulator
MVVPGAPWCKNAHKGIVMGCESLTVEELKARGQRLTQNRLLILRALRHAGRHMKPAELLAEVRRTYPHLPPSTVYRTLGALRDVGLVSETRQGGETAYEWPEQPHHHLTCRSCRREVSIAHGYFASAERRIASDSGYQVDLSHVSLTGLCPDCRGAKAAVRPTRGR